MIHTAQTEKKIDVIVIGGAGIDTFIFPEESKLLTQNGEKVLEFAYGEKIPVSHTHNDIGGGGANTAVGLSRHNLNTIFITRVGDDENASYILKTLDKEGVDISHIKTGTLNTGMSTIIQGIGRDRTIFTYSGANSELNFKDIPLYLLKKTTYILINSLYGQPSNIISELIDRAKDLDTRIALSLGRNEIKFQGQRKLFEILKYVYLLILNEEESKILYHTLTNNLHASYETCEACKAKTNDMLRFFKDQGVSIVGITLGASGVRFIDEKGKIYSRPSKKAEVINTTGLGDAFYSGFLAYHIKGKSIDEAIEHGIDNAVSVMGYLGAQIGLLRS